MDPHVTAYGVYGILFLVAALPPVLYAVVRRKHDAAGQALLVGWLCAMVVTAIGLGQVAATDEMGGYIWFFVITPAAALVALLAGFGLFLAVASRLATRRKDPPA